MKKNTRILPFATLVALLLCTALLFSACNRNETRVAGSERQVVYGYIVEINEQANTVTFDPIELVKHDDDRVNRLGMASNEYRDGYYLYNASIDRRMYPLASNIDYDFNALDDNSNRVNSSYIDYGEGYSQQDYAGTLDGYQLDDTLLDQNNRSDDINGLRGLDGDLTDDYDRLGQSTNIGNRSGIYNDSIENPVTETRNSLTDYERRYHDLNGMARLHLLLTDFPEQLYCLTIEDGKVVSIRHCSDAL